MMTAVTEVTRNASTASRGLNMISSRLVQVLDDSSSTGKKLTKIYNDLGISLKDEEGQLRSTYDILKDLASQWGTLSSDQQKYIALTSAGARQTQNFVALMENFDTAIKATATAYDSAGSAARENARVLDSISKKVEILRSEFQQLVLGEGGLQNFAKGILDVGIALLKFANSDVGQVINATALLMASVALLNTVINLLTSEAIPHLITSMVVLASRMTASTVTTNSVALSLMGLSEAEAITAASTMTLGEAFETLTAAMLANPAVLIIAGIAAAVAGLIIVTKKLNAELDNSTKRLEEYTESYKKAKTDVENLSKSLDDIKKQIQELENRKIHITDPNQLEELKKQTSELREQEDTINRKLTLAKQELEVARQQAEIEAKRNLESKTASQFNRAYGSSGQVRVTSKEELDLAISKHEELTQAIERLKEEQYAYAEAHGYNAKKVQKYKDEIAELEEELTEVDARGLEMANILQKDADALTSADEPTKKLKADTIALVRSWLDATDANEKYKHELEDLLDNFSKGGNVDLKLRPVIDTEELNKQGYNAGKGYATVFTHTFTNEANDIAINFTPIMTDPETGEYLGVMQKDAFEKYCQDVVNGVREDTKNLQIGVGFKKDEYDDFIGAAEEAAQKIHETSDAYVQATGAADKYLMSTMTYTEAVEEFGEESEEADDILKNLAKDLGISEQELLDNAKALGLSVEAYSKCAIAIKECDTALDNFQSALGTLESAVEEYNEQQYFSIDTMQSLLQLEPAYLDMLVEENGQLSLNEQAIMDKVNSLIEERKQVALEMAYERLQAIERGYNQTAAENESSAIDGNTGSLNAETTALSKNTIEQYANRIARNDKSKGTAASQVVRDLEKELAVLDKIGDNYKKISGSATKAGKSGKSGAKSATDAQKELNKELEETKSKYEKVISWISKQYDKEIDKIKKAKDEALNAEEAKIKAKEKEKDAALDAIEKEIQALEKEKKALKEQKEALDERKQALKDEEDAIVKGIEKRIKALEKERDALIKPVEERIKVLEKERNAIVDSTQTEIDALKELKEERQTYWDEQINALKEANKELKDNLELQEKLDALEKAKNTKVKVYKEGQGFVYDVDQNAVQEAQKALDEYLSEKAYEDELARLESLKDAEIQNYDDRINELTKYKDNTKKIYNQQISDLKEYKESVKENYDEQIEALKEYKETVQEEFEAQIELINQDIEALEKHMDELDKHKEALEEHKDAVEESYEAEIAELEAHKQAVQDAYEAEIQTWEQYKQEFEDMVNAYEEEQNRLLFEQLTGIKNENSNWMTRLNNLAKFVNEYNKLQQRLETSDTNVQNTASFDSGTSNVGGSNPVSSTSGSSTVHSLPIGVKSKGSNSLQNAPSYVRAAIGKARGYASGISSIKNDQIGLVGENPNQELVVGSKINSGQLMSLNKGDGVVNANSTKTLAGMLNQIGKFGASGFGSGNGVLNSNVNNDSLTINGVTIQGANIKDPETFVNSLLNLKAEALQRAYKHR